MRLQKTIRFIINHPMNHSRKLVAICDFLWWQIISRLQSDVTFSWIDGAKLIVRHGMTGATGNIYSGLHEYADMSFAMHLLRPGDLFVDVGANVGSYTILAAAVAGADVISVEPDPMTASALRRNVEANGIVNRVDVAETAIGDREDVIHFTMGKDTMNRVAVEADTLTREVPITPLDTLLNGRRPTLAKVDTEGHETAVLRGAPRMLNDEELLALILENPSSEVVGILSRAGFRRVYYDPPNRTLSESAAPYASPNHIFVRDVGVVSERLVNAPRRRFRGVAV